VTASASQQRDLPAAAGAAKADDVWRRAELISDLHLDGAHPATVAAFLSYLARCDADALFILGDLFEVWVGDDAVAPGDVADRCADGLASLAARGCALHFMAGNRDFLLGDGYAARCRMTRLPDPWTLDFAGRRWLLSHGDAWCLADADYQHWRHQVRNPAWMSQFLSRPLPQRQDFARHARAESHRQQAQRDTWADIDAPTARAALHATGATTLIHGHTHRPGWSTLGEGFDRWVLGDWDAQATPPRAAGLRVDADGSVALIDLC